MTEGLLRRIQEERSRRFLRQSRAVKDLFFENEQLKRNAEALLADLREFCFAQKSSFHTDALVMARREGRRDVWLRITEFLNLDEKDVHQFMEIDDGL